MTGPGKRKKRTGAKIWTNDAELELQAQAVADIYANLQTELIDQIITKVKAKGRYDLEREPYLWQLEKLNDLHGLNRANLQTIADRSGVAVETLERVIETEGLKIYEDTREQLNAERAGQYNKAQAALTAYAAQARGDLDNLTNTTLPRELRKMYQGIVEETVAEVVIGNATREAALAKTVMRWAERGFTGFTDAAGREVRADTYARAVIKTTTYSVYNTMRTTAAEELGVDTYYYSMKPAAREACAPLQGRIVTKGPARTEKGERVLSLADYGYGTAGGCLGVHCGHYLTPHRIGVNENPELPDYLKDMTPEQAQENARLVAKQRSLERSIREHKRLAHHAETLGDPDIIRAERQHVRNYQAKVRALVEEHAILHRDYNRERPFIG